MVRPGLLRAPPPGTLNDFNRYVDERPFRERLGDCASYTIEAASRRRSGNNLYRSIGISDLPHVAHLIRGRAYASISLCDILFIRLEVGDEIFERVGWKAASRPKLPATC